MSFVIHEKLVESAPKVLCCNLAVRRLECDSWYPFSLGARALGDVTVEQDGEDIEAEINLLSSSFDRNADLVSHLHEEACRSNQAGGHFKLNPSISVAQENNEVWLTGRADTGGAFSDDSTTRGDLRLADARSFVVHESVEGAAPKRLCCDFYPPAPTPRRSVTLECDSFSPTADGSGYASSGSVTVIGEDGQVRVQLVLGAMTYPQGANLSFTGHVHAATCADGDGGGHFKFDTTVAGALEYNEIWVDAADYDVGQASLLSTGKAKLGVLSDRAKSFVVHDARPDGSAGSKRLCCNLKVKELVCEHNWVSLTTGTNHSVAGGVRVATEDGSSDVWLDIEGLAESGSVVSAGTFPGHVHAARCADGDAGGHFRFDGAISTTEEANELWAGGPVANGAVRHWGGTKTGTPDLTAKSFVLHEAVSAAESPKRLCCDFWEEEPLFTPAPAAVTRSFQCAGPFVAIGDGYAATGNVSVVEETIAGQASSLLSVSVDFSAFTGAADGATVVGHVHAAACADNGGGGHWKIDESIAATLESNELWVGGTLGAGGAFAAEGVPRLGLLTETAVSFVVHESLGDGSAPKAVCCDLEPTPGSPGTPGGPGGPGGDGDADEEKDSGEDEGGLSGGAVAGIVIGVLLAVCICGALLWFFVLKK
jgi:hypothetical protein